MFKPSASFCRANGVNFDLIAAVYNESLDDVSAVLAYGVSNEQILICIDYAICFSPFNIVKCLFDAYCGDCTEPVRERFAALLCDVSMTNEKCRSYSRKSAQCRSSFSKQWITEIFTA